MKKIIALLSVFISVSSAIVFFSCQVPAEKAIDKEKEIDNYVSKNIWSNLNPGGTVQSARYNHEMVYIGNNRIILFGGRTSDVNDETWLYNIYNKEWGKLSPANKPPAMNSFAMDYIGSNKIILFGGYDGDDYLDETWQYDITANNWEKLTTINKPLARCNHSMKYMGNDKIVLYGGQSNLGLFVQTYIYYISTKTWTLIYPGGAELFGRSYFDMAYLGGDKVMLFGGYCTGDYLSDETFIFDFSDNTWTKLFPSIKPDARYYHSIEYIGNNKVILFGGTTVPGVNGETWEYDTAANTWTNLLPSSSVPARYLHKMVYIGSHKIVLFGGITTGAQNDTWLYER